MILKGSQRSGAKQLGQHLLNTQDNEHVEVHEVSGFAADDLMGAMREAYAVSLGTKCRQHLFSVSLSPPPSASVRTDVFENACRMIEERMGLTGQPRAIVFHEKEGRRHAHAVWSRIDPETMTARPMSFFKMKLRAISRDLYLENGWSMLRACAIIACAIRATCRLPNGSKPNAAISIPARSKLRFGKAGRNLITARPSPARWKSAACIWRGASGTIMSP